MQVPDYKADVCVAFAQGNMGRAMRLAASEHFNEIKDAAVASADTYQRTMELVRDRQRAIKQMTELQAGYQRIIWTSDGCLVPGCAAVSRRQMMSKRRDL